jgi:hypothetical protein
MSIGPWTIDDVMEQVSELVSHENEFWVREQAPDLAMTADVLHALRLLPDRERATFRLRKDGASVDIELASLSRSGTTGWIPALPIGHRPLYLRNGPLFYWYEYLPAERALYVN